MKRENMKGKIVGFICVMACSVIVGISIATAEEQPEKSYADLWKTTNTATTISANENVPSYSEGTSGVLIVSKTAGAEVEYKNAIDVTGGYKELISVVTAPTYRGSAEFKNLTITLTDYSDASIWMKIEIYVNPWWKYGVYTRVSTNRATARGYGWGSSDGVNEWGFEGTFLSFCGLTAGTTEKPYYPYSIWYDDETKTVYGRNHEKSVIPVLCLTDSDSVGYGNEWSGFTSGRAKLSIAAKDLVSAEAKYIVLSVCGQSMAGEKIIDAQSPYIYVDTTAEEMPTARTGAEYRFPYIKATDGIDGDCEAEVYVKAEEGEYKKYEKSFTPTEACKYTMKIQAADKAGNVTEKEFEFNCKTDLSAPKVQIAETRTEIMVGEEIILPQTEVFGGAGRLEVEKTLTRISDGMEYDISGGSFKAGTSGDYVFTVKATDWNRTTTSSSVIYKASYSEKPVLTGELAMYTRFIDGMAVELPDSTAYDMKSAPDAFIKANQAIKVMGTGEKATYSEIVNDNKFTPTTEVFGSSVKVVYTLTSSEGKSTEKEYLIPIIKAKQLGDYFETDKIEINYTNDNLQLTATEDAKAEYVVPVNSDDTSLQFRIPEEKANFEKILVRLTDSADCLKEIEMTLEKREGYGMTYLNYNGTRYSLKGSLEGKTFDAINAPLYLRYRDTTQTFTDYLGNKVMTVEKLADGSAFTGFPSGAVRISFELVGVKGEAAISLERICNQAMYADYDKQGNIIEFVDYVPPTIQFEYAVEISTELGKNNVLPAARAFDELTAYIPVTLTVVSPSGKTIKDKVSANVENPFEVKEQGVYQIMYYAEDRYHNPLYNTYMVRSCDNIPPMISIDNKEIVCETGKSVKLPTAIMQDNITEEPKLAIFVYNTYSEVSVITDGTFTPKKAGEYRVLYYVRDEAENVAMTEIKLIAE